MTAYVDSSALLKRYLAESDSSTAVTLLNAHGDLFTSKVTLVEVRRGLATIQSERERQRMRDLFDTDISSMFLIDVTHDIINRAAELTEQISLRSLDALHVASAERSLGYNSLIITFDIRQGSAARLLGFDVRPTPPTH